MTRVRGDLVRKSPPDVIYKDSPKDGIPVIRLLLGFVRLPDADVLLRGWSVYHGLLGNPRFPDPPVKLSDFKAELNSFASAAARAVTNGGKTAYAERNKQRAIGYCQVTLLLLVFCQNSFNIWRPRPDYHQYIPVEATGHSST